MTGKVEESISLLITRAEMEDVMFRRLYSGGYYLQVEIALFAGAKELTTMYLSSNGDQSEPDYIDFDGSMQNALDKIVARIKTNANISLERVGRQIENVDTSTEDDK